MQHLSTYLGIQFDVFLSISKLAKSFIRTGFMPVKSVLPLFSAMLIFFLTRTRTEINLNLVNKLLLLHFFYIDNIYVFFHYLSFNRYTALKSILQ